MPAEQCLEVNHRPYFLWKSPNSYCIVMLLPSYYLFTAFLVNTISPCASLNVCCFVIMTPSIQNPVRGYKVIDLEGEIQGWLLLVYQICPLSPQLLS